MAGYLSDREQIIEVNVTASSKQFMKTNEVPFFIVHLDIWML